MKASAFLPSEIESLPKLPTPLTHIPHLAVVATAFEMGFHAREHRMGKEL
jgi:hypothetical protein